ncbi:hypothetical protein ABGB12_25950 [Actinocorallia sp. B10E7]|uniref:hypothetical protein n=1 Tax=Actinocorallia sp. B10E7 TaxID=3153558 RepID=UPI00325EFF38
MRAAAFWLVAVLALLLPGGPASADDPPHALARLDRVATALEENPLFVDEELLGALDGEGRKRIKTAIKDTGKRLGTPVFVVLLPNTSESESEGHNDVFLHGLHKQLGKDGLYLMVDHYGDMEVVPFQVPRDLGYSTIPRELTRPADWKAPFADLPSRIEKTFIEVVEAPSGEPDTPRLYSTADPFGAEDEPAREPAIWGPFFAGLLLVGPLAAAALFVVLLLAGVAYGFWKRPPSASVRVRTKNLRAQADEELALLAALLPPPDGAPGRLAALRSYDAALLLSDEVGREPGTHDAAAAMDLVGVIVLARQGREVLEKGLTRPLVPCRVNPLHGPGVAKRAVSGMPNGKVCRACADAAPDARRRRTLKMPDGHPYHAHHGTEGRWKRGFAGQDLAERVLESFGVG